MHLEKTDLMATFRESLNKNTKTKQMIPKYTHRSIHDLKLDETSKTGLKNRFFTHLFQNYWITSTKSMTGQRDTVWNQTITTKILNRSICGRKIAKERQVE